MIRRSPAATAMLIAALALGASRSAQAEPQSFEPVEPVPVLPPIPASAQPWAGAPLPLPPTTRTTSAAYEDMAAAERGRGPLPNRLLLGTGAALLVAPYVAGVIVAAASPLEEDHRLYIPVAGPWLDMAQRPCSFGATCSASDNIGSTLLALSGLAQGAGVGLMLVSLVVPEPVAPKIVVAGHGRAPKAHVDVVPLSFANGGGLGAVGTF